MLFQKIQRTDADKIFTVVQNVAGIALSAGVPVVWDTGGSVDGVRVTKAITATRNFFVGITAEAAVDSQYIKVQLFGYNSAAYIVNNQTTAIALGDVLLAEPGALLTATPALSRAGAADGTTGFIYAVETVATSTVTAAVTKKVFIRAM